MKDIKNYSFQELFNEVAAVFKSMKLAEPLQAEFQYTFTSSKHVEVNDSILLVVSQSEKGLNNQRVWHRLWFKDIEEMKTRLKNSIKKENGNF